MNKPIVSQTNKETDIKVAVYGGNGFVGTRVSECLVERGFDTVAVSRTGHKPLHLKDLKWSESVRWCKGDASAPDIKLLETIDILVLLVGSPPIPTFSNKSYLRQVFMNGTTNVNAINAAAEAGVKQVILLGAKIPCIINTDKFGYAKGKRLALEAARNFANLSDQHSATVLKPGAIYGKRHLSNGKVVHLDWFMAPLSKVMPWQFVSVDAVAKSIAHMAIDSGGKGEFSIVGNSDI